MTISNESSTPIPESSLIKRRDYFAGLAMQALIIKHMNSSDLDTDTDCIADLAVQHADSLIEILAMKD